MYAYSFFFAFKRWEAFILVEYFRELSWARQITYLYNYYAIFAIV